MFEDQQGFSVLEIIVSGFILTIFLTSSLSLIIQVQNINSNFEASHNAMYFAQNQLQLISDGKSAQTDPNYSTSLQLLSENNGLSLYKMSVSYTSMEKERKVELLTANSNWLDWQSNQTCNLNPILSGANSVAIDLPQIAQPTDFVINHNNQIFISNNTANQTDSDIFLIDPKNLASPVISELHTGPGINTLALAGETIFAGNTSINAQIQAINVTQPHNLALLTQFKLPGTYNDNTAVPHSSLFAHGRLYFGLAKSSIPEFRIVNYDFASNQLSEASNLETNSLINSITNLGDSLLLALPTDNELLEISPIPNPSILKSFDAPGGSGNGKSVSHSIDYILFGRTLGNNEFYILNKDLEIVKALDLNFSVNDQINDNSHFLLAKKSENELQLYDFRSAQNPETVKTIPLSASPIKLRCTKSSVYVLTSNPTQLLIF